MSKKLVFLGMGGTIAGTALSAGDNVGYTAAQVGVQQLLDAVPGLQRVLGDCQAQSEQVCQIDSKDLVDSDWAALLGRVKHHLASPEIAGVVVTHGTDTLEETAYFLARTLPAAWIADKAVVLTCAMRPASSLTPDGPANMADAASVALSQGACGVLVVCAGKIHGAVQVQKVHPYRVDAFDSGEAGPLGVVEEGVVRRLQAWPAPQDASSLPQGATSLPQGAGNRPDIASLAPQDWPRVELLLSHAGAGAALVHAALQPVVGHKPLRGLVVAGTGNGTLHKDMEAALLQAQAQGVRVLRVSRCAYGQVVGGSAAGGAGTFAASGLSAVKARIALMLELAAV